jgi:hypothetical protein
MSLVSGTLVFGPGRGLSATSRGGVGVDDFMAQMRADEARERRLAAAMNAEGKLVAARAALERYTWREPLCLVQARRAVQAAEVARGKTVVPAEELRYIADRIIQLHLVALRGADGRYASSRHSLHPEVDSYFDQLVADVAAEVAVSAAKPGALPSSPAGARALARRHASELPELQELLTAPAVRATLTFQRDRARAVAADPAMFTQRQPDGFLTVQHAASGLRARFDPIDTVHGVGRFGSIYSKHYRISSIDPSGAEGNPDYFEGLGIGAMIYRHGAAEHPDVRWRGGSLSDPARGLRRRLHVEDPYIWAGPCSLCDQHFDDDRDWHMRAMADFPPH